MTIQMIRNFFRLEAAGGIILVLAAALALVLANSPLAGLYTALLELPVAIQVGKLEIAKPLLLWINDGLMAVFFFLVGLEIKREFLQGEMATPAQVALPGVAAVGGMVVPAGAYLLLNQGGPTENLQGWAIPTATDIAFALGVLGLLGRRVPLSLKVLLTAIAIFDDLGAIIIIALFYTAQISALSLGLAAAAIAGLVIVNRMHVVRSAPYVLLGIVLWTCVLKSGVHATLAGVVLAFAIPMQGRTGGKSPLRRIEHALHPWVAFGVLPLFGFANAGVSFAGLTLDSFLEPVTLGIAGGLFVGKQVGVFACLAAMIGLGLARKPERTGWLHLYGVSVLCGIGFTMSLFIGSLAFEHADFDFEAPVRLGVLSGSVLSALLGTGILLLAGRRA